MKQGKEVYEVRWHGRGGQGAVSSAQMLAEAAYYEHYRGVTAAPFFGAERRGVPVTAATRFSPKPIRVYSQIESPDAVIVLDGTLLDGQNVLAGLNRGGWLVVNSARRPSQLGVQGDLAIATVDATGIARQLGLVVAGNIVVNTAMLGAFVRATGLLSLESLRRAMGSRFGPADAERNFRAACLAYDRTSVEGYEHGKD